MAAGFLDELGVTLDWPEVCLLTRRGGGELRANRPPGKLVLTRGLRGLLDLFAAQVILADEARQHGELPPRLAALLRCAGPRELCTDVRSSPLTNPQQHCILIPAGDLFDALVASRTPWIRLPHLLSAPC